MIVGELVYIGINPSEMPLRHALTYVENIDEVLEVRKKMYGEILSDIIQD
ncbi:MAG: hypothetical protein ABEK59_11740 [Halobacteria archaeon]